MKLGFVGNGVVGSALCSAFRRRAHECFAYDVDPARSECRYEDLANCDLTFVCLPTPLGTNGSLDTSYMTKFFATADTSKAYVIKSTVPVGFTEMVHKTFPHVVHSPEFLTARTAKEDAHNPRLNVIGRPLFYTCDNNALGALSTLYEQFMCSVYTMLSDESEAMKLFMNAWFATKVAAFNEFEAITKAYGLSWSNIRDALIQEGRIEALHTQVPGPDGKRGFGGACLPKDLSHVINMFLANVGRSQPIVLSAVQRRNVLDRNNDASDY